MTQTQNARIFVSYSRSDRAVAVPVVQLLRLGNPVFYDGDIEPGKQWRIELASRIEQAEMVVVLWCCHTAKSPYVEQELAFAIGREKALVPVRLCDAPVPPPVDEYQWIDLSQAVRHPCVPHPDGTLVSDLPPDSVLQRGLGVDGSDWSIKRAWNGIAHTANASVKLQTGWWSIEIGATLIILAGFLLARFGVHSEIAAVGSVALGAAGLYQIGRTLVARFRTATLLRRIGSDPDLMQAVLTIYAAIALALRGTLGKESHQVRSR